MQQRLTDQNHHDIEPLKIESLFQQDEETNKDRKEILIEQRMIPAMEKLKKYLN